MTVKEYADKVEKTVQAIHYQIKIGKLEAKRIGSIWLVKEPE